MLMWTAASMARSVIIAKPPVRLLLKLCCVKGDHKLSY